MKPCLLAILFLLLSSAPAFGVERSFDLAVTVPAGETKTARLKNLVKDAVMTIRVDGDDPVEIGVLGQTDYLNFPNNESALFSARSYDNLSFTITIPDSDTYYLVLDNRHSTQAASLQLHIKAVATAAVGTQDLDNPQLDKNLSRINDQLGKLFLFESIPINLESCGQSGAFASSKKVTLCVEFVQKLQQTLNNEKKATDVLLYAIFHEISHVLLLQWKYPFYDNEEIADDMATALMLFFQQKDRLDSATEFFLSNPLSQELMSMAFKDNRHPLSIQRARNIISWMNDQDRLARWRLFLLPHMQTDALEKLANQSQETNFKQAIRHELAQRQ